MWKEMKCLDKIVKSHFRGEFYHKARTNLTYYNTNSDHEQQNVCSQTVPRKNFLKRREEVEDGNYI